jgi:hypothetical protein
MDGCMHEAAASQKGVARSSRLVANVAHASAYPQHVGTKSNICACVLPQLHFVCTLHHSAEIRNGQSDAESGYSVRRSDAKNI